MGAERQQQQSEEQPRAPASNTITHSQFLSWKRQKDVDALAKRAEIAQKRAEDIAAGRAEMNGRELFLREPWVFDNSRY